MTASIQEQLKAIGRVQVIVVLKSPEPSIRLDGALGSVAPSGILVPTAVERQQVQRTARELERHFIADVATRAGALASAGAGVRDGRPASTALESASEPPVSVFDNLGVVLGTTDRVGLRALADDDRVASITAAPEFSLIRPVKRAARSRRGTSWGLNRLGITALWDQGITGRDILIGHLDTGVEADHPALKGAIAEFAEFDWLGRPVPKASAQDPEGHGTHTAGTMVGRKVGTMRFGVAPQARIASALVIEGGNVVARILGGLNWLVGLKVRVIGLSLGLRGYRPDFLPVVRIVRARQILPVIAVGNEGPGSSRSPGNYEEILSVGACDAGDQVSLFSSSQRFRRRRDPVVPSLIAPGVDVFSCIPGGRYAEYSGTSMATPHVAGLAALLFGAHPEATADQVERAILDSCTLPAGMLSERANRGIPLGPTALANLRTALGLPATAGVPAGSTAKSGRRASRSNGSSRKSRRSSR